MNTTDFKVSDLREYLQNQKSFHICGDNLTLSLDLSMEMTSLDDTELGSKSTAERAAITSEAVWMHRMKGETKTR